MANNDEITKIFDWLYLGGVRNTRKTLPYVNVWYDFKWDRKEPRNLVIPSTLITHHIPFDDGDLEQAIPIWQKCFDEIIEYKKDGKTVFVSCYEGVSRSAVLCLWLCCHELGDYSEALKYIKQRRNIFPDKKFTSFLQELQKRY